jgi:hypothetical protein
MFGAGDIQTISSVKQIHIPDKSKLPFKNFTNCLTLLENASLIFAAQSIV